jgi:hypothetical protein
MDYLNTSIPGFIVPQRVFPSSSPSNIPPIKFSTNGVAGVHLQTALNPNSSGLLNANQPISLFNGVNQNKITFCMQVSDGCVCCMIHTESIQLVAGIHSLSQQYQFTRKDEWRSHLSGADHHDSEDRTAMYVGKSPGP